MAVQNIKVTFYTRRERQSSSTCWPETEEEGYTSSSQLGLSIFLKIPRDSRNFGYEIHTWNILLFFKMTHHKQMSPPYTSSVPKDLR